jgi:hypothetical protein
MGAAETDRIVRRERPSLRDSGLESEGEMLEGESLNARSRIHCRSLAVERAGFKDQKPLLQCHSSRNHGLEKRLVALLRTSSLYRVVC